MKSSITNIYQFVCIYMTLWYVNNQNLNYISVVFMIHPTTSTTYLLSNVTNDN